MQKEVLELHFEQCFKFWKSECTYIFANSRALIDLVRTNHNPFKPKGEKLDADVRREVLEKYLQEYCVAMRRELEKYINEH